MHIGVDDVLVYLNIGDLLLTRAETLHIVYICQVIISFREFMGHLFDSLISLFKLRLKVLNLVL